jgi:putative ABC transport system ATP-binding protein
MTMDAIVTITDLAKSYGRGQRARAALRGVSLSVGRGEWVAVVGPSGCGKSTLLHLVAGLDAPDSGSIRICGDEITGLSAAGRAILRRRRVGLVFQAYNLIPHLHVSANVELGLRVAGATRRAARTRAHDLLDVLGLADIAHAKPGTLSGGQQQRVAIARAVAGRPDVLLADEPTGALDTKASRTVVDLLRNEHQQGQTVVMVTHDYAVASAADRVVFLRDGQIVDERRTRGRVGAKPAAGPDPADPADLRDLTDLLGLGNW